MRKNIITLLIASTFGIAVADYKIEIPMEISNGGALQNGSISFKSNSVVTPPVVIPPVEPPVTPPIVPPVTPPPEAIDECMPLTIGSYVWRVNKNTGAGTVIWNGTTVGSIAAGASSMSGANGIVYTRNTASPAVAQGPMNLQSGVCRNIPGDFNGGSWVRIAPILSAWVNKGSSYNCTWTPDPSNFLTTQNIEQHGSNCSQDQERTSQSREQNDSTFVIRNIGAASISSQTIPSQDYPSRTVSGTEIASSGETCINESYSSTSWNVDKTNNDNVYNISWKGGYISVNENLGSITTFTYQGVVYKRGAFLNDLVTGVDDTVYAKSYGVCRVVN